MHFPENTVQRSYFTNLSDGKINKIAKGRITRIFNSIPLIVDPPQCTTTDNSDIQVLNKTIELQGKEYQQQQHHQLQQQEQFHQQETQQNEFQNQGEQSDDNSVREKHYLKVPVKRKLIYPAENITIKTVKQPEHSIDYNNEVSIIFYYIIGCNFIQISTKFLFF